MHEIDDLRKRIRSKRTETRRPASRRKAPGPALALAFATRGCRDAASSPTAPSSPSPEPPTATVAPVACFTTSPGRLRPAPGAPEIPPRFDDFDASCAVGDVREYRWFFEGGPFPPDSLPDVTLATPEPRIQYSWAKDRECFAFRPFERTVRLTVADAGGRTASHEEIVRFHVPFLRK